MGVPRKMPRLVSIITLDFWSLLFYPHPLTCTIVCRLGRQAQMLSLPTPNLYTLYCDALQCRGCSATHEWLRV